MALAEARVRTAVSEGYRPPPAATATQIPVTGGWPRLRLLRPRQWIKNAFVLAPLIFSGSFIRPDAVIATVTAVVLFCIASSATYVFNDLRDREADRLHPVKRYSRPIASGAVSVGQAKLVLAMLCTALLAGFVIAPAVTTVIAGYLLLNIAYTIKLKRVPVVDLFALAAGFALRVQAGAIAVAVEVSPWMLITTLCLALYLAAVKRRDELTVAGDSGREVLKLYTPALLDRFAERAAIGAMVFYGLFVITVRPALAGTIPLVLFGMFRYSFVVDRTGSGESPTDALWRDRPLALSVIAWALLCALTLWPR